MAGNTDKLGFGCVALSAMRSTGAALAMLHECYGMGIRHFDTAPLYGRGYSELILKRFIKQRRGDITITTKFGLQEPGMPRIPAVAALPLNFIKKKLSSAPAAQQPSAPAHTAAPATEVPAIGTRIITLDSLKAGLQNSLTRLGTDYIDYYLLHEGLPAFLTADALDYLLGMRQKGIVRKIGIAANAAHICTLDAAALSEWDVLQYDVTDKTVTSTLLSRYSNKEHIHHSCLNAHNIVTDDIPAAERPGYILAAYAAEPGCGKVLFSTKSNKHLESNVRSFHKHINA